MRATMIALVVVAACAHTAPATFPLRDPFAIDTDTHPVAVPCRADPGKDDPHRMTCAPVEYHSPFLWNEIENTLFGPLSRLLAVDVVGEAVNANSLDEVADSAWFQSRIGAHAVSTDAMVLGACKPDDLLPTEVADGAWVIDHGKDNGSTPGFRIDVPGKGKYLLKADDLDKPERASAASVIGADLYAAAGFYTSCEQIVYLERSWLKLEPGLFTVDNEGGKHPFDEAALAKVLASSTHDGTRVRMQASKWLPGLPIGPFRYEHTRDDDPNDVIDHENRRELRGSRLLAAWMNHWDSREQNSMDLWIASDAQRPRSSPGYVRHYILDTSDAFGGSADPYTLGVRLGRSYIVDFGDVAIDFVTLGMVERPWDRVAPTPGREKFGYFSARDFDPAAWKGTYPNPAFLRMTERDAAWMARIIARFTEADLRALVGAGRFHDPSDAEYLTRVMLDRQRAILARYLTRLSPLADVHVVSADQMCAVDLARLRGVLPEATFRYTVVERGAGRAFAVAATPGPDGQICFAPRSIAPADLPDAAPGRVVVFDVDNGTGAGLLQIHTYDLGPRGLRVVGLTRPEPR